ncbi:MAG: GFA family protein [Spongiibacteraceae bacterium]|jgi:hypothetical protein|nr:GFA family protein [Spongiibacteraceae bacterium]
MLLKGSCHCGAVTFQLESAHPYPFNLCYCSVCRKTAGGGGFAINLGGDATSFKVKGETVIYHARIDGRKSPAERHFCGKCGSVLWLYDKRWPELIHPLASAIDTELPIPPERTHLMLASKAPWVVVRSDSQDQCFDEYPAESIAEWHERLGLTS